MIDITKRLKLFEQGYWDIPEGLDTSNFDFTWRPDPYDRPYIHEFGTQWQKTGGPRFVIPESEGTKYQSHQHAIRLPRAESRCFRILKPNVQFDYSWHPDSTDPPYIYVFGNQHYDSETMPTVQYRVKGATEKKYIKDIHARLGPCMDNWIVPDDISAEFDYSWVPHPYDPEGLDYQFGTQWQKTGGPLYKGINSHTVKYIDVQRATKLPNKENRCWRPLVTNATIDYSWHPDDTEPPFIYVFGNQHYDSKTMPTFQYRVKGATEKKYVDLKATLLEDKENWTIPDDIEDNFDYSWKPSPYEPPLIYQFGTQWQKTGGPRYTVPGATTVKYTDIQKATKKANMRNWRIPEEIEDGFDFTWHPDDTEEPYIYEFGTQHQKSGGPLYVSRGAVKTKYCADQIAIRKANMRKWRIIEEINRDNFDFSWHPDNTDGEFNYLFGNQFHSTEFMPTVMYRQTGALENKYLKEKAELLVGKTTYDDSLFDAMWTHTFDEKYVHFQNSQHPLDYSMLIPKYNPENLYVHLIDNVAAVIPKGIKNHFVESLTDYPYVIHHELGTYVEPLDIVFFSNGEACAEENYQHLLDMKLPNRIVRVDGVQGRVASQHAAAKASNTSWYFLVNAKLKVDKDFDFNWQPDRYKSRRHYIFTAVNPVNLLNYGHMAMVANNKKLTLETVVRGLDFTMDSKHEVVDMCSGVAMYNSSEWDTWRTAFREVIKLCRQNDEESKKRLEAWLNYGYSAYGHVSKQASKDAVEFYESVNGDMTELMKSYDWEWLKTYYQAKYAR